MSKFDFHAEKDSLIANLNYLKSLPVKEYTLRVKWDELQNEIYDNRLLVHAAHYGIWKPSDLTDKPQTVAEIEALKPRVILANDGDNKIWWDIYRLYCSTAEFNQPPTRHIRFLVVDGSSSDVGFGLSPHWNSGMTKKPPGMILGVGAISGEPASIPCRDKLIGWSTEQRFKMLPHYSAIGSTIVPMQPLGYNFLGGKLIAALTTSATLRNEWQLRYGDVLVAATTTSLYGDESMYNGMEKWWMPVGKTDGTMPIQLDDAVYAKWRDYVKEAFPEKYEKIIKKKEGTSGPNTGVKAKIFSLIFRAAGIKADDFKHRHERGVYFSPFYQNTNEFLRGEITEDKLVLRPEIQNDTNAILTWWREQAKLRYKYLWKVGKLKPEILYYNHGFRKSYQTFKEHHLKHVGR